MKNILFIFILLFASCAKEEMPEPMQAPDVYEITMQSEQFRFDATATDSIGLYVGGEKVGLTLFAQDGNISVRAYYHYATGMQTDASGTYNGSSFMVKDGLLYVCNGSQGLPVQMLIKKR